MSDLFKALYPPNFHRVALSSVNGLGAAIAIILGVLAQGSEYGWGTLKTVLTQKPGRLAVFAGKWVALALVALLLAILIMLAAAITSAVLASIDGQAISWPDAFVLVKATAALWLILVVWTALGVMLAVIFQQSALAMGIGLVYGFVIEGLVFGIFGSNPTLQNIEKGFPWRECVGARRRVRSGQRHPSGAGPGRAHPGCARPSRFRCRLPADLLGPHLPPGLDLKMADRTRRKRARSTCPNHDEPLRTVTDGLRAIS